MSSKITAEKGMKCSDRGVGPCGECRHWRANNATVSGEGLCYKYGRYKMSEYAPFERNRDDMMWCCEKGGTE